MPNQEPKTCSLWELNWVKSQPPGNVQKAIAKGSVRVQCLPEDLKRELGLVSEKAKEGIKSEEELEKELAKEE